MNVHVERDSAKARRVGGVVVTVLTALLAIVGPGGAAVAQGSASSGGSFLSTIHSPWANACVDVPGGTTDANANLVLLTCSSSAEQQFTFVPETDPNNGLAGYSLFNQVSGLCVAKFRYELRQNDCAHATPVPGAWIWRLIPVNTAAKEYLLEPTYPGATAQGRCMSGQGVNAGYIYTPFCDTTDASQYMVLAGLPS